MHILILPSWYPADPTDFHGSFFREQAVSLQAAGMQVGVIAASLRSLRQPVTEVFRQRGLRRETDEGVITYRLSSPNLTFRIQRLRMSRMRLLTNRLFDAYIADHGLPDLVHVHSAIAVAEGALDIRLRSGLSLVLSEHSSAYARGTVGSRQLRFARQLARDAARRFAVSGPFANLLDKCFDLAPGSFGVMPNAVEPRFLTCDISANSDTRFRFLHISGLDKNKNADHILRAFAAVFRGNPNIALAIGGDGPMRTLLMRLATDLEISSQVQFLGRLTREGVLDAMRQSDIFVLASKYETFGVVLIEALAMGLKVIATKCGGPDDIILDDDGILVPVDDVGALSAAMHSMAMSPQQPNREAIRARCLSRFGRDLIAERWRRIYTSVIARR